MDKSPERDDIPARDDADVKVFLLFTVPIFIVTAVVCTLIVLLG